ncbi:MAG: hypothetical protein HY812_10650 [Planctomycetes bacterium]|nr:hypothetical protein [Planctomycetota bacterium]
MNATWRFISLLTAVLNRLIVLAATGALVSDLVREPEAGAPGLLSSAVDLALAEPVAAVSAAALLILLNLNVVQFTLYSLANTPARSFITSQAHGGKSRVALSAIQRALQATALQVHEVARARVRVHRAGRKRLRVHVRYKVREVLDAGTAAEHLRVVLKRRFSELVVLDPSERVEFDLDMAGIRSMRGAAPAPKRLPPPPDVVPTDAFKGPVYPVEGEVS